MTLTYEDKQSIADAAYLIDKNNTKNEKPYFYNEAAPLEYNGWNEETQTYWFRGKYERYDETNSPGERNSSKIKITYLDGSTNR